MVSKDVLIIEDLFFTVNFSMTTFSISIFSIFNISQPPTQIVKFYGSSNQSALTTLSPRLNSFKNIAAIYLQHVQYISQVSHRTRENWHQNHIHCRYNVNVFWFRKILPSIALTCLLPEFCCGEQLLTFLIISLLKAFVLGVLLNNIMSFSPCYTELALLYLISKNQTHDRQQTDETRQIDEYIWHSGWPRDCVCDMLGNNVQCLLVGIPVRQHYKWSNYHFCTTVVT